MSATHQRRTDVLRRQVFDLDGPGTVLRDFETLLEFIGPQGLPSSGKYHLLPLDRLFELDDRMSRPLRPPLDRPQQRSFPHLNGLYLLLRATRLGVAKGEGKKTGMLALDPPVLDRWRSLNWTEKYFNLLEAWLRLGRREMLGAQAGHAWENLTLEARQVWQFVRENGPRPGDRAAVYDYWFNSPLPGCLLALFELFGMAEVERTEPVEGENRRVRAARPTAFGEALVGHLPAWDAGLYSAIQRDEPVLGAWQTRLQPFFPEWRNNLQWPEPEFRDGVYYFRVSLGRPWRRIAIPADHDLDELARWIIRAFDFDGDHLYKFSFTDRDGTTAHADHPYLDDAEIHTDEYSIGYLPLDEGQSMKFLYDFGANWELRVILEKVDPPNRRQKKARIVESHGAAPPEYEYYDD